MQIPQVEEQKGTQGEVSSFEQSIKELNKDIDQDALDDMMLSEKMMLTEKIAGTKLHRRLKHKRLSNDLRSDHAKTSRTSANSASRSVIVYGRTLPVGVASKMYGA